MRWKICSRTTKVQPYGGDLKNALASSEDLLRESGHDARKLLAPITQLLRLCGCHVPDRLEHPRDQTLHFTHHKT